MPFHEILGQPRAVHVLQQALATNNVPHAYLFYGMTGVGRFRTARTLAAALFCEAGREGGDACGLCSHCRRVEREEHPGLSVIRPVSRKGDKEWEVDPERGEIRIDQVRELQKWLAVRSFEGGWRVCILDGAERMNPAAANALLKTLEEPPPESLLLVISPTRTQLPPTVVSRCRPLYFPPVPRTEIEHILRSGGGGPVPENPSLVAALSGGSVGKALRMSTEWVTGERRQWIRRLIDTVGKEAGGSLVSFADDVARSPRVVEVLDLLVTWYRDLAVFCGLGDTDRLLNLDLADEIRRISACGDAWSWAEKARAVQRARASVVGRQNLNLPLLMETTLLRLGDRGPVL